MKKLITLFLILTTIWQANAQSNEKINFDIPDSYKKDSIVLENMVEFYTYSDDNTPPTPAVRFKIKVTNLGNCPIPNLMRVSNRSEYLQLFYNDKNSNDLNICNGMEGNSWPWHLGKNELDTFETGFVLSKDAGIYLYGNTINVKWNYVGIDSPIVVVDILNKKIIEN